MAGPALSVADQEAIMRMVEGLQAHAVPPGDIAQMVEAVQGLAVPAGDACDPHPPAADHEECVEVEAEEPSVEDHELAELEERPEESDDEEYAEVEVDSEPGELPDCLLSELPSDGEEYTEVEVESEEPYIQGVHRRSSQRGRRGPNVAPRPRIWKRNRTANPCTKKGMKGRLAPIGEDTDDDRLLGSSEGIRILNEAEAEVRARMMAKPEDFDWAYGPHRPMTQEERAQFGLQNREWLLRWMASLSPEERAQAGLEQSLLDQPSHSSTSSPERPERAA